MKVHEQSNFSFYFTICNNDDSSPLDHPMYFWPAFNKNEEPHYDTMKININTISRRENKLAPEAHLAPVKDWLFYSCLQLRLRRLPMRPRKGSENWKWGDHWKFEDADTRAPWGQKRCFRGGHSLQATNLEHCECRRCCPSSILTTC